MKHLSELVNEARLRDFKGNIKAAQMPTIWVYAENVFNYKSIMYISNERVFFSSDGDRTHELLYETKEVRDNAIAKEISNQIDIHGENFFRYVAGDLKYSTYQPLIDNNVNLDSKDLPELADDIVYILSDAYPQYQFISLHDKKELRKIHYKYSK